MKMKVNIIIDAFWPIFAIWGILYAWVWSNIPSPMIIKDILYALGDILDYWLYLNAILGTVRLIKQMRQ